MKYKIFSILFALALIISTAMGIKTTAYAADSVEIESVTVTSVPETIEAGKLQADYASEIVVPESEQYDVLVDWLIYEEDFSQTLIAEDEAFVKGEEYVVRIYFMPKEGYTFPEDPFDVTVNAENYLWFELSTYRGQADKPAFYVEYEYSLKEVITEAEMFNIPVVEPGAPAVLDGVTLPENANYFMDPETSSWYDYTADEKMQAGAVFQEGHKYQLVITLVPNPGYCFSEDAVLQVDGENNEDEYMSFYSELNWARVYSLADVLEDAVVELTMDTPVDGKTVKEMKVSVPEDAQYSVKSVNWYNIYEFEPMGKKDTFKTGNEYSVEIVIAPPEGYVFDEGATLNLNGAPFMDFMLGEDGSLTVFNYYSLYGAIDKVEINNVSEAVIGEKVSYEGFDLPEGVTYAVDWENTYWMDVTTFEDMKEGDVFENGHEYMLSLTIIANENAGFAESVQVFVNGEQTTDYLPSSTAINVLLIYSFLDQVEMIEILEALPEAVVGKQAEEILEFETPDDAKYTVGGAWYIGGAEGELEAFTGVFEEGKAYIFALVAMTDEGFSFGSETEVFVNGESVQTVHQMNLGTIYMLMQTHDLGDNTIDVIEITILEPKAGEEVSVSALKVSEEADYEILEAMWIDPETGLEVSGTFEEGKKYELSFAIIPLGNKLLANDLMLTVNGDEIAITELSEHTLLTPMAGAFGIVYDLTVEEPDEKDDVMEEIPKDEIDVEEESELVPDAKPEVEEENTKAPLAGDGMHAGLWFVALIVSFSGIVSLKKKSNR